MLLSNQKLGFVAPLSITDARVLAGRDKPKTAGGLCLRPKSVIKTPVKYSPTSDLRSEGDGTSVFSKVQNLMYLRSKDAHAYVHREAKLKASEAIAKQFTVTRVNGLSTPRSAK